jgi:hypothetical protein
VYSDEISKIFRYDKTRYNNNRWLNTCLGD